MLNSDFLDISNIVLFNRVLIFHLKRKLKNKSWPSSVKWFLVNFIFIFNWRIIALECCVGFCHTTVRISHISPPSWTSLPAGSPPRSSQSPELNSVCYTVTSHWLSISHTVVCIKATLSIRPTPSFPCCVHKTVLCICVF